MRGKRAIGTTLPAAYRNIPAYAGKTGWPKRNITPNPEHPRVCGENVQLFQINLFRHGTSPRMRGKRFQCPGCRGRGRNIPAYAGKTELLFTLFRAKKEHPRVCGENRYRRIHRDGETGTSPRMRGKLALPLGREHAARNIPAYAGKTNCLLGLGAPAAEHPRVCGENPTLGPGARGVGGTSPRMRGKHFYSKDATGTAGNIPAYAGKTPSTSTW